MTSSLSGELMRMIINPQDGGIDAEENGNKRWFKRE